MLITTLAMFVAYMFTAVNNSKYKNKSVL